MTVGVILYGPPASGKDTVTRELTALDEQFRLFERLKVGSGKSSGYRMTGEDQVEALRRRGEVVWENVRYGSTYVVDQHHLDQQLDRCIPVVHLGQGGGVSALKAATPGARWHTIYLWCPRSEAAKRFVLRGDDVEVRLAAWDETVPIHADLLIDTSLVSAAAAASQIHALVTGSPE